MESAQLGHLLRVLHLSGTGLNGDDVAWAFESAKTKDQMTTWVDTYLLPETFLAREELAFFEKHGRSTGSDETAGPQLVDEDFEAAITSLEASTISIEKRCKLLEAQKKALHVIQARNGPVRTVGRSEDARSNKLARGRAQIEFEATELADSIQSRVERSLKQAERATSSVQPLVETVLDKDDRLLDGLEKVLMQLSSSMTESEGSAEVDRLCQALTTLSSEEIHARIDSTYHTAAKAHSSHANGTHQSPSRNLWAQHESLRMELENLCREIDGLSSMAVDTQFRSPLSKALHAADSDSAVQKTTWIEYLSITLQYLTDRLGAMNDGSQQLRAQSHALKSILATLGGILAADTKKQISQASTRSPTKPSQQGLKPLRLVQANLSDSHDPAAQLLRQLDVRPAGPGDTAQLAGSLLSWTRERNVKLLSLADSSADSVAEQIAQSLAKVDEDLQALISRTFAYSNSRKVHLASKGITDGIESLEYRTQETGNEMRELNAQDVSQAIIEKQHRFLAHGAER
ncbi:hypothetical protein LTR37_013260 [Vermiconidia calcicola]|uniref:Uncharacterized protein n=1 Tax=Vermiconidia calcicola TaxID=1690605 RepID=A0ACC3MZZ4_9PEZI|nr:hypothetical protein LTR37_013260 [Vermiconidia calcicola]